MEKYNRGVTLLELMVVVVIVGILASIAVPSYRSYVLRAQRSDAMAALLRVAAAQEKFYLQNNTYTNNFGTGGLKLASGATTTTLASEHGYYDIAVAAPTGTTLVTNFTVTATAPSTSPQYADTFCRSFTLTESGAKTATNAAGTSTSSTRDTCWR